MCPNWARTDLCGGREVTRVPTAKVRCAGSTGDAGHDNTELAALAFDGVAQNQRRHAGIGRGPRRRSEGERGRDDDADGILGRK